MRTSEPHWAFGRLFEAPHRLAFAAATLLLALASLWWAVARLAAAEGWPLPWGLPPPVAHGLVMGLGFMPLYFTGFLFTAGPKWLSRPPVPARTLLAPVAAMVAGWLVFGLAMHGRDPAFGQTLGAIGLAAVALGWLEISARFVQLLFASRVGDRVHARLVALAALLGALALLLAACALGRGDFTLVRAVTQAALWGFVGLVFVVVSHRMIPFFSAAAVPWLDAWRPLWLLGCFVALCAFEALAAAVDVLASAPQPAWAALRAALELPAGLGLLALALRWGLVQSLRIRLLAMLHVGFCWLGLALLLSGIGQAFAAAGRPGVLGLAPLHAYTMGFLGSTMFAMVTRVSGGQGGRVLAVDAMAWRLFWLLQLAVLARLAAALSAGAPASAWLALAALCWAGACGAWALRHGRWYGLPRVDGRPG